MWETFTGAVTVDPSTAPKPMHSLPASITGTYDIFYSCPMDKPCKPAAATFVGAPWKCKVGFGPPPGHCSAGHGPPGGPHSMVEQKGIDGPVPITVYSLFDSIIGPECVEPGAYIQYSALGYPAGGDFLWSNGVKGTSITLQINEPRTISLTYTIKGVSYKASKEIKLCCKCEYIGLVDLTTGLKQESAVSGTIQVPPGGSAKIVASGCRILKPVWDVDGPGYISSRPDDSTVVVKSTMPFTVHVCATYPQEDGNCRKCIYVNFNWANIPNNQKNTGTPEGK